MAHRATANLFLELCGKEAVGAGRGPEQLGADGELLAAAVALEASTDEAADRGEHAEFLWVLVRNGARDEDTDDGGHRGEDGDWKQDAAVLPVGILRVGNIPVRSRTRRVT